MENNLIYIFIWTCVKHENLQELLDQLNSKASQKFCNILITRGTIRLLWMLWPRLWRLDSEVTWYSPSATCQFCLYDLKPSHDEGSCNPSEITWTFWFLNCDQTASSPFTLQIFLAASKVALGSSFKLRKHKFPNKIRMHVHLCRFQITPRGKWYTTYHRTNYHNTNNHSQYLWQLKLLCHVIYALQTNMYQNIENFWLTLVIINTDSCVKHSFLVSLFNGISTFLGYLMPKPSL